MLVERLTLALMLIAACGPNNAGSTTGDATTGTTGAASTSTQLTTAPTTGDPGEIGDIGTGGTTVDATTSAPSDLPACGESRIETVLVTPPSLALVVERSGSLVAANNFWDHDADDPDDDGLTADMAPATPRVSRWQSVSQALASTLAGHDARLNAGLALFPAASATPGPGAAACPVDDALVVPIGPMRAGEIVAALPDQNDTTLAGASPATRGVKAALAALQALDTVGSRFIVLITDGAPNCREGVGDAALLDTVDDQLAPLIADALAQGIPTEVVGIAIENVENPSIVDGEPDGVRPFIELKRAAIFGGATESPWFRDAQDQVQLQAELEAVMARALCTFPLLPLPDYPSYVELDIGGVEYGKGSTGECDDEHTWRYLDKDTWMLELCNQACADFLAGGEIVARFRCPND